jgi:hypothetical protein
MLRADPFNKPVFAPCVKACDAFLFSHPLTLNLWPQCEHSHSALRTPSLIHFIASGGWSQLINYIPSQLSVIFIFMSQKHVARGRICTLKFNVIVSILLNMLLHTHGELHRRRYASQIGFQRFPTVFGQTRLPLILAHECRTPLAPG